LWWALNHESAERYEGTPSFKPDMGKDTKHPRSFHNRVLLLIDEIDKADRSVPNSLLEALGNYSFDVPYVDERVECEAMERAPLIIVTTNNEQELPRAFVRRCLVLDIEIADATFVETLAERGKALFQDKFENDDIFTTVAEGLLEKRKELAQTGETWMPGQAEYLDHLEAILALRQYQPNTDEKVAIDAMAALTYNKQRV